VLFIVSPFRKLINYNLQITRCRGGHFTQIAVDRVSEMGCGMVKFTKLGWKILLMTCNYSSANVLNFKVCLELVDKSPRLNFYELLDLR